MWGKRMTHGSIRGGCYCEMWETLNRCEMFSRHSVKTCLCNQWPYGPGPVSNSKSIAFKILMHLLGTMWDELWTRQIRLRWKHYKPRQGHWPSRKRAASNCTNISLVGQYLHYYHASSTHSCEGNAHRSPTPGWSMRDYSHWFSVDCEDMRTIRVHCRGCLISPCSAESLAYVLCPVINVNLCSL